MTFYCPVVIQSLSCMHPWHKLTNYVPNFLMTSFGIMCETCITQYYQNRIQKTALICQSHVHTMQKDDKTIFRCFDDKFFCASCIDKTFNDVNNLENIKKSIIEDYLKSAMFMDNNNFYSMAMCELCNLYKICKKCQDSKQKCENCRNKCLLKAMELLSQ